MMGFELSAAFARVLFAAPAFQDPFRTSGDAYGLTGLCFGWPAYAERNLKKPTGFAEPLNTTAIARRPIGVAKASQPLQCQSPLNRRHAPLPSAMTAFQHHW
jgi:hypothetical protein